MKKVAIYGAGERGLQIKKVIDNMIYDEIEIVKFIDKDEEKINKRIEGIEIISLEELLKNSDELLIDKIIIAANQIHHMEIVKELYKIDVRNVLVLNEDAVSIMEEKKKYKIKEVFEKIKPTLNYLEFHVTDDCNLNCKGCGHFSNLAPKNSFANFEQFRKDINRLSDIFSNILKIRIMGGEPLLNKDLDKFIVATRKAFPYTDLHIVTNGLLIPQMNDNLIKIIKDNSVAIDISWYNPTIRIKDDIISFLKQNNLNCNKPNINRKERFFKQITLVDTNDKYSSAKACSSNKCHFLCDGYISKCGMPFLIKYLKQSLEVNSFDDKNIKKSLIDIYDENINGFELFNFLDEPSEFCKYCSKSYEFYDWETRNSKEAKLEDWVIY